MSLFDNFIKRVAIDADVFNDFLNELDDEDRESKLLSDADKKISELKYDINKKLDDVIYVLDYFSKFLRYPDNLNMMKNEDEKKERQKEIDADPSKYQQIVQKNPYSITYDYESGNIPGISRGHYTPQTNVNMTTETKNVMNNVTLEDEITGYLDKLHKDITAIKSDISSLQEYIDFNEKHKSDDEVVTYPVEQFKNFDPIVEDLDTILQEINQFIVNTKQEVSLVTDQRNLVIKTIESPILRNVIQKVIRLKTFISKHPKLFVFDDSESKPSSIHKKLDAEDEISYLQDLLLKNSSKYVLLKKFTILKDLLAENEKTHKLSSTQEDIAKKNMEELFNQIRDFKSLSEEELEDIHSRIGELSGVIYDGKSTSEFESYTDSAILVIDRIRNFLKEYGRYFNPTSDSLFSSSKLNDEFNKLVEGLDYYYNEYKEKYKTFPSEKDIPDDKLYEFLTKNMDWFPEKKDGNKYSVSTLISDLIQFINTLKKKITKGIKSKIKDVFKESDNYDSKYSKTEFNYKIFMTQLVNNLGKFRTNAVDTDMLGNLFQGATTQSILNKFSKNLSTVAEVYTKNPNDETEKNGFKLGLLYILYNSVEMLYTKLRDTRDSLSNVNGFFERLVKDSKKLKNYESVDISFNGLDVTLKEINKLYSGYKKILDPVLVAKNDIQSELENISIAVNDEHGNFKHDFNIVYINNIVKRIESLYQEINKAIELFTYVDHDLMVENKQPDRLVINNLLNVNANIKNETNDFDLYSTTLNNVIAKFIEQL